MKQLYLSCLVLLVWNQSTFAQEFRPKYLRTDDPVIKELAEEMTPSGWIYFREGERQPNVETFFETSGESLGLDEGYSVRLFRDEIDGKEIRHQHYQVYYNGVPIEGMEYGLHSRHGRIRIAHGKIVDGIRLETTPSFPEEKALEAALREQGLTREDIKEEVPESKLLIRKKDENWDSRNFVLTYAFDIHPSNGFPYRVYIHAHTGELVGKLPLFNACSNPAHDHGSPEPASGHASPLIKEEAARVFVPSTFIPNRARYLDGQSQLNFETEPLNNQFTLRFNTQFESQTIEGALRTRLDLNNNFFFDDADLFNPTTTWGNNVQDATTVHWTMQRTYQYFLDKHERNGIDVKTSPKLGQH